MKDIRKLTFQSRLKLPNNVNSEITSDSCMQQFVHPVLRGKLFKVDLFFVIASNAQ